jgi:hypothetical protein
MCQSTNRTQSAAGTAVRKILPNQAGVNPQPPPNAFLGKAERVPELVFIMKKDDDSFLKSAVEYYSLFGLTIEQVDSIAAIIKSMASSTQTFKQITIVSHAHPRGMIMPFFTGGVIGTDKEVFREFGKSNLDGLKLLSPFPVSSGHLFNWNSLMSKLTTMIRGASATVLQPFGLQTTGDFKVNLKDFVRYCFDIVYLRDPGRVRRNAATSTGLNAVQRTTLENFVGQILDELKPLVVAEYSVTPTQVNAVKSVITGFSYAQLVTGTNLSDANPHLGLEDENMNDFPTLKAVVTALQGGFRNDVVKARNHVTANTRIDIRGCRVGQDADYVEAVRELFGTGDKKPTVTAPRWFQQYPKIGFRNPTNVSQIRSILNHANEWGYTPLQRKTAMDTWADLIRVKPLHFNFWQDLLNGKATHFASLQWLSKIPPLFIPTPGISALATLNFDQMIGKLKDYFAVPNASVPSASVLTGLRPVTSKLPAWASHLLTPPASNATQSVRKNLFSNLQQINTELGQALVPATSPNAPEPPDLAQLKAYQTALVDFLDTSKLTAIKTFMTAAADSLTTGDGLYFYMIFTGVPVFIHGTPALGKNGLIVLDSHKVKALQSWYQCLWKDPLPATGPYKTATIDKLNNRQVTALVGDDRTSLLSICPMPKYMDCIRKRPLPQGEDESLCS